MSDSISSDFDDDDNWILELETILLENCDFFKLRTICNNRPIPSHLRKEVWKICLNVNSQIDHLDSFNDLFDLPNQDILHENCCEFVATLPKDLFPNTIGFISDIEIILTYFSRTYKIQYEENNGWLSILRVLCCELHLHNRNDLYSYFAAICHHFLPSASVINREIFSVFRLLLQYHDPELCSFLDTHRLSPDLYSLPWFTSLFSSHISHRALVKLWDIYFLVADPFLMFYLALIVVLNLKESLLEIALSIDNVDRSKTQLKLLTTIQSAVSSVSEPDVEDFHLLAQHYITATPKSFQCKFSPILFGNANKTPEIELVIDSLCMPISVHELLDSKSRDNGTQSMQYFLVDCRPADQYNAGHLSSAYFLDSSLILSSPSDDFQTSVVALLSTQQQALEFRSDSAGEHICFLGSGNPDEDRIVNMVVAQFLRKMTKFVSTVYGGYRAIHDVLGPQCGDFFLGHDAAVCQVCLESAHSGGNAIKRGETARLRAIATGTENVTEPSHKPMNTFFTKFSNVIKVNSSKIKHRFGGSSTTAAELEAEPEKSVTANHNRHYHQSQLKHAKTYRNTGNIFSIDDDGDVECHNEAARPLSDETEIATRDLCPEMINLDLWLSKPDVIASFDCCIVDEARALQPGHLLLTQSHLFVLKRSSASKLDAIGAFLGRTATVANANATLRQPQNMVSIHRRRLLSSVVKITSKRRYPECLTFHYLLTDGATVEQDRYVIDKAGEAARMIKIQVQKMIDAESAEIGGGGD